MDTFPSSGVRLSSVYFAIMVDFNNLMEIASVSLK